MIVWVIFGLIAFVACISACCYCLQGSQCGKDVIILMLHKFPDANQSKEFRKQIVSPLVKRFGGTIEFSGQVLMTYCGNETWDSIVFGHFPSHAQAQAAMTEVLKKERSFSQHLVSTQSKTEFEETENEQNGIRGIYLPIAPQSPLADFLLRKLLGTCCAAGHIKELRQNLIWKKNDDQVANREIIPSPGKAHLLPTLEQREKFSQLFEVGEPLVIANIIELEEQSGEIEYMQYAYKMALFCLPKVGARILLQAPFITGEWSSINLTEFPFGSKSFLRLEELDNYHDCYHHREKSLVKTIILAIRPDPIFESPNPCRADCCESV